MPKREPLTLLEQFARDVERHQKNDDLGHVFFGIDAPTLRAIRKAAKKWPAKSLGIREARNAKAYVEQPDGSGRNLCHGDDAYWIKEAIRGRHWGHGYYRLDEGGS